MDYSQATKEILSKHLKLPAESISDTDLIEDIKPIDSIAFASIITELEQFVGEEIPVTEWISLSTVGDLINIVKKHTSG